VDGLIPTLKTALSGCGCETSRAKYSQRNNGSTTPCLYYLCIMLCPVLSLQCNMDKDCALPPDEADTKEMAVDERDLIVGNVYRKCATRNAATVRQPLSESVHKPAIYLLLLRCGRCRASIGACQGPVDISLICAAVPSCLWRGCSRNTFAAAIPC